MTAWQYFLFCSFPYCFLHSIHFFTASELWADVVKTPRHHSWETESVVLYVKFRFFFPYASLYICLATPNFICHFMLPLLSLFFFHPWNCSQLALIVTVLDNLILWNFVLHLPRQVVNILNKAGTSTEPEIFSAESCSFFLFSVCFFFFDLEFILAEPSLLI